MKDWDEVVKRISARNNDTSRFFFQKINTSDDLDGLAHEFSSGNYHGVFDFLPSIVRRNSYHQKEYRDGIFEECLLHNSRKVLNAEICMNCPRKGILQTHSDFEKRYCCRQYVKYKYSSSIKYGYAFDFQIPLKDSRSGDSKSVGEIDLLLRDEQSLVFAEAKRLDNKENIIKAILEIETYCRILGKEGMETIRNEINKAYSIKLRDERKSLIVFEKWWQSKTAAVPSSKELLRHFKTYVIKADSLEDGKIEYFNDFSPKDY